MKIRTGFVSNSSSTSFAVSSKNEDDAKITISFEIDLSKYASYILKTKEEVNKYYMECRDYRDFNDIEKFIKESDEIFIKEYKDCIEEIEKGNVILVGCFSNEDEAEEKILCEKGIPENNKNIKVIYNDTL